MRKGIAIIWGVEPLKNIVNIPSDAISVKVRMRHNDAAKAIVRFRNRVELWVIVPETGYHNSVNWKLGVLQSVSHHLQ